MARVCGALLCCTTVLGIAGCTSGSSKVTATPTPVYTLQGGGACVQLGYTPKPPYANVRVSDDTYLAHSEPMVAENPSHPLQLVGGSKFFTNPAHYQFKIGYYYSSDGGCTWHDGGVLPGFEREALTSDVTFAFDAHGNAYALVLNTSNASESGVSVSASHDGGATFSQPVSVYDNTNGSIFSDKPWIAVDQTHSPYSGTIYVVWSYDDSAGACATAYKPGCSQHLGFSRSTDGGQTFSPPREIEGSAPFCMNPALDRPKTSHACDAVLGATPVVLPDGSLVIIFDYVNLDATKYVPTKILAIRSTDGGSTWSNPVLVATVHDIPPTFPGQHFRNFSLPAAACDPQTGQIYVAWADEAAGQADILLTSSTDEGTTWGAPVRVNDDSAHDGASHFQPALAVAPDGVASVSFFDTRNDPNHKLIDVYLAQSVDHGATFLPNVRVTTTSWDPNVDAPIDFSGLQFIGDYQGIAADNHFVHPFWNDTRTGSQEIFTAAVPSAQPPKP
jgi:hypothetical protein